MTYEAPNRLDFKRTAGLLSYKVINELKAIETELETARTKVAKVALTGGAATAIAAAWQNPETSAIFVTRAMIHLTTAGGTATAVLDAGTAANATTGSDNLIDGVDANTTALYDNITDKGSNGKSRQLMDAKGGTTDHVTVQIKTEAATALAGYLYIEYIPVA